jgi:hypothetical protein
MKALRYVFYLALFVVFVDQVVNFVALRGGFFQGRRVAPFDPPIFNDQQLTSLLQIDAAAQSGGTPPDSQPFDAELGWVPQPGGHDRWCDYDAAGARADGSPLAATKSPDRLRVAALGCSFTHGLSCASEDTWPSQLERLRSGQIEVANLGVTDYGADQVLLRERRELPRLQPDEVWFGWRPGASLRITTVYPAALDHGRDTLSFKPRFELEGGQLHLVPSPAQSAADFMRLCTDQKAFLAAIAGHDDWIARTPLAWAPSGSSWRHHFGFPRLLLTLDEDGDRNPDPWLSDRNTSVARLLQALVLQMAQDAAAASARFRLLVLPDRADLRWRQRTGMQGYWADAVVQLADRGIEVLDVSPALEAVGATDDGDLWQSDGLYGKALNAAVAEFLATRISRGPTAK